MSYQKNSNIPMYLLVSLIVIGVYFLFAYLIQITFNNSIVPIFLDPSTSKHRISKLSYWNAFALFFLIALLVPGCYNPDNYYKLMSIVKLRD